MAEGNVVGSGGGAPGSAAFTASWCFTAVLGGVKLFQSHPGQVLSCGFESAHGLVLHRPALDVAEGIICLTKTFLEWKFHKPYFKKETEQHRLNQTPSPHTHTLYGNETP